MGQPQLGQGQQERRGGDSKEADWAGQGFPLVRRGGCEGREMGVPGFPPSAPSGCRCPTRNDGEACDRHKQVSN